MADTPTIMGPGFDPASAYVDTSHDRQALLSGSERSDPPEKKPAPFLKRAGSYLRSRLFPGWDKDERTGAAWFAARFGESVVGLLGGIAACASFWAGNFQLGFALVPIIVLTAVGVTLTMGVEVEPWQYYVGELFGQWVESFSEEGRIKQAFKHVQARSTASDQADKSYADSKLNRKTSGKKLESAAAELGNRTEAEKAYEKALLVFRIKTTLTSEWPDSTNEKITGWNNDFNRAQQHSIEKYEAQLRDLSVGDGGRREALLAQKPAELEAYQAALKHLTLMQFGYLAKVEAEQIKAVQKAAQARKDYLEKLSWQDWLRAVFTREKHRHDAQSTAVECAEARLLYEQAEHEAAEWLLTLENEQDYLTLLNDMKPKGVEKRRIAAHAAFSVAHKAFLERAKVWWKAFFEINNMLRKGMWLTVLVNSSTVAMACALWFLYFFAEVAGLASGGALPICVALATCYLISSVSFNKFLIDTLFNDTDDAPPKFMEDPHYRRAYAKAKTWSYIMGAAAGVAFTGLAIATILSLPWSWPVVVSLCVVGGSCILVCQTIVAIGSMRGGFKRALEKKYQKHLLIEAMKKDPETAIVTDEVQGKALRDTAEMPQTLWSRFKELCLWIQSANRGFFTGAYITKTFVDFIGTLGLDPNAGPLIMLLTALGYVGGILLAALYVPYDYYSYNSYLFKTNGDAYLGKDEEVDSLLHKPNYSETRVEHVKRAGPHLRSWAHFLGCSLGACPEDRKQYAKPPTAPILAL